ncbi:hypothetical protein CRYUN_Cryun18bG0075700 [Craigia yunnanensis]
MLKWRVNSVWFCLGSSKRRVSQQVNYLLSVPLGWWEGGDILGGKDGQAGGTWLASSREGRLAFITNVKEFQSIPQAKSRGHLPVRFFQIDSLPK